MNEVKPIETYYKGYRFRSRLEARWAVFFDALGIEWEYEKEGYEFEDGTRYLPDFWIPENGFAGGGFFEVKPLLDREDRMKALTILQKLYLATDTPCYLLEGLPDHRYYASFEDSVGGLTADQREEDLHGFYASKNTGHWGGGAFGSKGHGIGYGGDIGDVELPDGYHCFGEFYDLLAVSFCSLNSNYHWLGGKYYMPNNYIGIKYEDPGWNCWDEYRNACNAARSARFEFKDKQN